MVASSLSDTVRVSDFVFYNAGQSQSEWLHRQSGSLQVNCHSQSQDFVI